MSHETLSFNQFKELTFITTHKMTRMEMLICLFFFFLNYMIKIIIFVIKNSNDVSLCDQ